jgi:hypothetical protein
VGSRPLYKLQKGCTRLAVASDKVYQLLAHGRWYSPGTPASSTTKTGRHNIAEILLKVALNTKNKSINQNISNQSIPKNLLLYTSILKYLRTEKTGVTPMRIDGQITTDKKQKSNTLNKQCQSVFTVEPQDNIPDCTKTHIQNPHSQYLYQVYKNSYILSIRIKQVTQTTPVGESLRN